MITLSQSKAFENFPATLEVRILDWFTAATKTGAEFAGIDLAGFFEAGDYTVMVTIDQGTDEVLYYRRAENRSVANQPCKPRLRLVKQSPQRISTTLWWMIGRP